MKILKQPEEIKTCIMNSYADEGIFFMRNNAIKKTVIKYLYNTEKVWE